jgi:hypothetical protein
LILEKKEFPPIGDDIVPALELLKKMLANPNGFTVKCQDEEYVISAGTIAKALYYIIMLEEWVPAGCSRNRVLRGLAGRGEVISTAGSLQGLRILRGIKRKNISNCLIRLAKRGLVVHESRNGKTGFRACTAAALLLDVTDRVFASNIPISLSNMAIQDELNECEACKATH